MAKGLLLLLEGMVEEAGEGPRQAAMATLRPRKRLSVRPRGQRACLSPGILHCGTIP